MSYQRPTNPNLLSKAQKVELLREYSEYYRKPATIDQSALNRKVPRDAFAALLDQIGKLLIDESKQMARSPGPVRELLNANPLPPTMTSLLPDEFRTFCLALNALKQWVGAEQSARIVTSWAVWRGKRVAKATADCLVTGEKLGPDAELQYYCTKTHSDVRSKKWKIH